MKKYICGLICIVMAFCLCSCEKKASSHSLDNLYTVNAHAQQEDFECEMSLTRLGNNAWDITFTSPDSIKDMNITYEDGNAKISYMGLETTIAKEQMKFTSSCDCITTALDNFAKGKEIEFTKDKNQIFAKGKAGENEYKLIFDNKSKGLVGLSCDDLEVEFSDYKKMQ